jgi:amino acid adenylation domain-containing protein
LKTFATRLSSALTQSRRHLRRVQASKAPQAADRYRKANTLLQHGVSVQAQTRPEATALVLKSTRLTYGALEEASNRLAHLLADAGVRRADRVALMMPKTPTAVVGMLGVLKAGAIYVPMDLASPAARQARMLEVSDCRCVLAAGPVGQLLRDTLMAATLQQQPIIGWVDDDMPPEADLAPAFSPRDLAGYPPTMPSYANTDKDVAHILFTSGSTGVPKGVMITHTNVVHFLRWATAYFGTTPTDRISQHPPLHFDLSTFDIFGTLWAGAELHFVPAELNLLPHKLAQFIREARLTQWFSVPSVLNLMAKFDAVHQDDFPELRRVMWCGEAIPTPTLIHWMRRLPHVHFTNLYGPTEATIASSYYTVPRCPTDEREPIPIGTACDGEELLVLDSELRPVVDGEIGDLYIRGAGLSPGYWRDPHKTRSVFLQTPGATDPRDRIYKTGDLARRGADGLFYFVGRADMQIKSRGYRIELGEIEAALNSLPGLRESAVVAIRSDGFEGWLICCAFVPAPGHDISPASLREGLARLVPSYMLPARWTRCDALPRNANGKIDRPCLKSAFLTGEQKAGGNTRTTENAEETRKSEN